MCDVYFLTTFWSFLSSTRFVSRSHTVTDFESSTYICASDFGKVERGPNFHGCRRSLKLVYDTVVVVVVHEQQRIILRSVLESLLLRFVRCLLFRTAWPLCLVTSSRLSRQQSTWGIHPFRSYEGCFFRSTPVHTCNKNENNLAWCWFSFFLLSRSSSLLCRFVYPRHAQVQSALIARSIPTGTRNQEGSCHPFGARPYLFYNVATRFLAH